MPTRYFLMGNIWKIPQNFLYLHLHFKRKKNWLTYKEKVLCETNIMMRHSEPGSCVVIIIEIIYSQECFNRFYYLLSVTMFVTNRISRNIFPTSVFNFPNFNLARFSKMSVHLSVCLFQVFGQTTQA